MNEHIQIILGAMSFQNGPCFSWILSAMEKQKRTWKALSYHHFLKQGSRSMRNTQMNVIEWRKDAYHQDWLWNNAALKRQSHIVILWNMRVDSRTRKIIKHRRTLIEYAKSLIEMTLKSSTLLEKLSSWGQYSRPWKGKTSSAQISYEAMFKWWISELKKMMFKDR